MKRAIGILIVVIVVALVAYRVVTHGTGERPKSIPEIQQEVGVPVEVAAVERMTLRTSVTSSGMVEGLVQADAVAKLMEKLETIQVRVGDRVKEGQVLAAFNKTAPTVRYEQTKVALEEAKRDHRRAKTLYESGAVALQAVEKAKMAYDVARLNVQAAEESIQLLAPISGVVTEVFYKEGETAHPGASVLRIARMDRMIAKVYVSEAEIGVVRERQDAVLTSSSFPGRTFSGTVTRVSLSTDPVIRTFPVWIEVSDRGALRPGMFVEARIFTQQRSDVLVLPADAILLKGDIPSVYVIEEAISRLQVVEPGISEAGMVEIVSGVQEGDRVVVEGHNRLTEGEKVKVVEGGRRQEAGGRKQQAER